MEIDRRKFSVGLAAALTVGGGGRAYCDIVMPADGVLYAAARRDVDGRHVAAIFHPVEGDVATVVLPGRGHDAVARPGTDSCVVFARRPGNFAVAFAANGGHRPVWFTSPEGRHFYGHGVFSADGRLLYATENVIDSGAGAIGIYDATAAYRRIGSFSAFGTGPHDIALLPDGVTLVIANGGIETHPDSGRTPLNLASMTPSLAYVDCRSGDLLEQHVLPHDLHRLSIRHLAATEEGTVVFGCQYHGSRRDHPALVGVHTRGDVLRLIDMPSGLSRLMRGYVGSIDVEQDGVYAMATSPRGNTAVVIDIAKRKIVERKTIADVSGVAAAQAAHGFLVTDGHGNVSRAMADGGAVDMLSTSAPAAWDNHVALVSGAT